MFQVERALLIINRTAGVGHGEEVARRLGLMFKEGLGEGTQVQVELVSDHPAARACAAGFLNASEAPAVIIAGGGGGTLRAVIEGICSQPTRATDLATPSTLCNGRPRWGTPGESTDESPEESPVGRNASTPLPGRERVRVGALRMGSGNLLAKQFGVPSDPVAALRGLLESLKAGRTVPCCVMRCEVWKSPEHSEVHHFVTLGGLGQFGRIPSDLARWHARLPSLHASAARLFGIERLTNLEYALALLLRSISGVLFPGSVETVEVHFQSQNERMRLLSGVVMNFPIKAFPFKPEVRVEDEVVFVYLIPLRGRLWPLLQIVAPQRLIAHTRCIRLEKNQRLEIRFADRDSVEFFLDEDPITTSGRLSFEVAGSIAFVPGPDYQPLASLGVSP
jgi:diacylglycerol kinase family enzyme